MPSDLFAQMLAQYMAGQGQGQPDTSTGDAILGLGSAAQSLGGMDFGGGADFAGTAGQVPGMDTGPVSVGDATQAANVQNFMGQAPENPMMAPQMPQQTGPQMPQQQAPSLQIPGGGTAAIENAPMVAPQQNQLMQLLAALGASQ